MDWENERDDIPVTGLEDMAASDMAFLYAASSLLLLGVALVILKRKRMRSRVRYYRR